MLRKLIVATALAAAVTTTASAAEVTLKIEHFLPAPAPVPKNFITPWAQKVEKESNGRIKFEIYPSMQLGGKPPSLFDQIRDGVIDIGWTLPGYTPGRFPRTEVFEMPFMPTTGEATSKAAWDYFDANLREEFKDVHIITVHVHGPGLMHVKGNGVNRLEDLNGLKMRGPTRMINNMLKALGATPVGMPVPAVPSALSKGVIDGTVIPWEVTKPFKIAELVNTHTTFAGDRGFYTAFFIFAMNKNSYEKLPADLKKVIDDNSGRDAAAWVGRVMDEGDQPGLAAAQKAGNRIVTLDEAETARWKEAAKPVIGEWIAEMKSKGIDGAGLYQQAKSLVAKYAPK
jgi:TRAP-type C4-dicarboxylate transport system substrate-binding protein